MNLHNLVSTGEDFQAVAPAHNSREYENGSWGQALQQAYGPIPITLTLALTPAPYASYVRCRDSPKKSNE